MYSNHINNIVVVSFLLWTKGLPLSDLQNGLYMNLPSRGGLKIPAIEDPDPTIMLFMFSFSLNSLLSKN